MTQKEFMNININIIKQNKNISYEISDGIVITFEKENNRNSYRLLLNGHEVGRRQNYSTYSIRNSFLYIKNNLISFKYTPIVENNKYVYTIGYKTEIPNKIIWENVKIVLTN